VGFDVRNVAFLARCRKRGIVFASVATLGRQTLHMAPEQTKAVLNRYGFAPDDAVIPARGAYAEPLLQALGATEVVSMDANSYEGATILHDMNTPIAAGRSFDCLIDGGTMEHVFNAPVAMQNCMDLVRQGGHVIHIVPANNEFGHGFYQFSPEFFYRVYSEGNGFRVVELLAVEVGPGGRVFQIPDPLEMKARTTLRTVSGLYIMVLAQKIAADAHIRHWPQQSDYEFAAWQQGAGSLAANALRNRVLGMVPGVVARWIAGLKALSDRNPAYKRITL